MLIQYDHIDNNKIRNYKQLKFDWVIFDENGT
jgi:hypothetical protein